MSNTAISCLTTYKPQGLILMPEQYDELKKATDQLIRATDKMQEQLSFLITMHEVGKRDYENMATDVKRAFQRIDKLESKVEVIKETQISGAWMRHLATAGLTGLGTILAMMIFNYGDKL